MVTACNRDWKKHKEEVYEVIKKSYGSKFSQKFVDYYSKRYDSHGRSFIDYRLAFWLLDDYHYVNKIGTRWYACVGIGGTGKSTLLRNVFYYFDPTFTLNRTVFTARDLIKKMSKLDTTNSLKSILIDEPDDTIHPSSKHGKALREILGKGRQQKIFLGICATDLTDIPTYIFRKLHGIFFLPSLGSYFFFKDRPKAGAYVLQAIRREYYKKGYKVFYSLKDSAGCLRGHTMKATPFDTGEEKGYLKTKKEDFKSSIDRFLAITKGQVEIDPLMSERDKYLVECAKQNIPTKTISAIFNKSVRRINELKQENRHLIQKTPL